MADPVTALLEGLISGDLELVELAAFDIVTTRPPPTRAVTLSAEQVFALALVIDALVAKKGRRARG